MKTNDVILQTVTRAASFIILTFAVYLFLAGHHDPGGGFVGGLLVASAATLLLLAYDLKTVKVLFKFDYTKLAVGGVFIAVATGMGAVVFGEPFLTHTFGTVDLPMFGATEFATAVLFDVGVAFAVFGTALSIIYTISEDMSLWKH